ncbi:hypothetical protein PINS_up016073 [Pythium insidiosum]|nr:hypothetical protein PINS_up016073 [Pythium insidiosum]
MEALAGHQADLRGVHPDAPVPALADRRVRAGAARRRRRTRGEPSTPSHSRSSTRASRSTTLWSRARLVTCSRRCLCDLNYTEESARAPQLVVALNPRTQKLNLLQMECKLPLEIFESLMGVAMEGGNQIFDFLQNAVRENTWKRLRSRGSAVA